MAATVRIHHQQMHCVAAHIEHAQSHCTNLAGALVYRCTP